MLEGLVAKKKFSEKIHTARRCPRIVPSPFEVALDALYKGQEVHSGAEGFLAEARRRFGTTEAERMPRDEPTGGIEDPYGNLKPAYMREYPYTKNRKGGINIVGPRLGEDGFEDPDAYKYDSVKPASHKVAPEFDFSSSAAMESLEDVLPPNLMSTVRSLMQYAREKPSQKEAGGDYWNAPYFEPERYAQQLVSNYLTQMRPDVLAMRGVRRDDMTDSPLNEGTRENPDMFDSFGEDPEFFAQTNPYARHYHTEMPKGAISPDTYAGKLAPIPGMNYGFKPKFFSDGSMKVAGSPMDLAWRLLKGDADEIYHMYGTHTPQDLPGWGEEEEEEVRPGRHTRRGAGGRFIPMDRECQMIHFGMNGPFKCGQLLDDDHYDRYEVHEDDRNGELCGDCMGYDEKWDELNPSFFTSMSEEDYADYYEKNDGKCAMTGMELSPPL